VLVIAIVCIVLLYRFERSWLGLIWSSINENDQLARSSGVDVKRHKQLLIVVTSFFMGGRAAIRPLWDDHSCRRPGPRSFTASVPHHLHDGGRGHYQSDHWGVSATIVPELGRSLQQYIPLFMGAILLLVVFVFPKDRA
jgi:hypothetical protein